MTTLCIGFLGAGQMATALAKGVVEARIVPEASVSAADPDEAARKRFAETLPRASVSADNREVARRSDVIVLAVKPHVAADVVRALEADAEGKLIVSVAAGVRLA